MLSVYVPRGTVLERKTVDEAGPIPDGAVWFDLVTPTTAEDKLLEATLGIAVPKALSVVGFDDLFIATYTNPALTTISQPMRQMGSVAMEILLKLFNGADSKTNIKVQGQLIVRESTAAPRSSH